MKKLLAFLLFIVYSSSICYAAGVTYIEANIDTPGVADNDSNSLDEAQVTYFNGVDISNANNSRLEDEAIFHLNRIVRQYKERNAIKVDLKYSSLAEVYEKLLINDRDINENMQWNLFKPLYYTAGVPYLPISHHIIKYRQDYRINTKFYGELHASYERTFSGPIGGYGQKAYDGGVKNAKTRMTADTNLFLNNRVVIAQYNNSDFDSIWHPEASSDEVLIFDPQYKHTYTVETTVNIIPANSLAYRVFDEDDGKVLSPTFILGPYTIQISSHFFTTYFDNYGDVPDNEIRDIAVVTESDLLARCLYGEHLTASPRIMRVSASDIRVYDITEQECPNQSWNGDELEGPAATLMTLMHNLGINVIELVVSDSLEPVDLVAVTITVNGTVFRGGQLSEEAEKFSSLGDGGLPTIFYNTISHSPKSGTNHGNIIMEHCFGYELRIPYVSRSQQQFQTRDKAYYIDWDGITKISDAAGIVTQERPETLIYYGFYDMLTVTYTGINGPLHLKYGIPGSLHEGLASETTGTKSSPQTMWETKEGNHQLVRINHRLGNSQIFPIHWAEGIRIADSQLTSDINHPNDLDKPWNRDFFTYVDRGHYKDPAITWGHQFEWWNRIDRRTPEVLIAPATITVIGTGLAGTLEGIQEKNARFNTISGVNWYDYPKQANITIVDSQTNKVVKSFDNAGYVVSLTSRYGQQKHYVNDITCLRNADLRENPASNDWKNFTWEGQPYSCGRSSGDTAGTFDASSVPTLTFNGEDSNGLVKGPYGGVDGLTVGATDPGVANLDLRRCSRNLHFYGNQCGGILAAKSITCDKTDEICLLRDEQVLLPYPKTHMDMQRRSFNAQKNGWGPFKGSNYQTRFDDASHARAAMPYSSDRTSINSGSTFDGNIFNLSGFVFDDAEDSDRYFNAEIPFVDPRYNSHWISDDRLLNDENTNGQLSLYVQGLGLGTGGHFASVDRDEPELDLWGRKSNEFLDYGESHAHECIPEGVFDGTVIVNSTVVPLFSNDMQDFANGSICEGIVYDGITGNPNNVTVTILDRVTDIEVATTISFNTDRVCVPFRAGSHPEALRAYNGNIPYVGLDPNPSNNSDGNGWMPGVTEESYCEKHDTSVALNLCQLVKNAE